MERTTPREDFKRMKTISFAREPRHPCATFGNRYWQPMVLGLDRYGTALGGFNKLEKSMVLLLYRYGTPLGGFKKH